MRYVYHVSYSFTKPYAIHMVFGMAELFLPNEIKTWDDVLAMVGALKTLNPDFDSVVIIAYHYMRREG